jgi:hypothetical protein
MSLPIRDFVASQAVLSGMTKARQLRDNVQRWKALADAGTTADIIINCALGVKQLRDLLQEISLVPGLDAAARSEYNDPTLNFSAELSAIVSACDSCLSWINTNFPKDANGYLLERKLVAGAIVHRSFSSATLAGLSTQLQTLLDSFS